MKRILISSLGALIAFSATMATQAQDKQIYIPKELQANDFNNPESEWANERSLKTPNIVIFWEKGFGNDLANPPQLEEKPMDVDIRNLAEKLERFYNFYVDTLKFTQPGSKSEKYRMMVMLRYSNEGTAYGGDYDGEIGALWVTPNRLRDSTLNCIAHELGHSFQAQIGADGAGESWGGAPIFETAAQWMLWQVNPNWVHDEAYHWEQYKPLAHRAFLHFDNIYHAPYVLESWGSRHGLPFMAELFRQGKVGEDPVITYKRMYNMDQEAFNDEIFADNAHILNMDYPRVWNETRPYAASLSTPMETLADGWMIPAEGKMPESYGFNAVEIAVPQPGAEVVAEFEGLSSGEGYTIDDPARLGWRYGFVAVDSEGKSIYAPAGSDAKATQTFKAPEGAPLQKLWFVVMGAPKEHKMNPGPRTAVPQFPYRVRFQ